MCYIGMLMCLRTLDLPEAFGPTINCRSLRGTSILRKFLQFLAISRLTIIIQVLFTADKVQIIPFLIDYASLS